MRRALRGLLFVANLAAVVVSSGCQVDAGATSDAACAPSPDYFVSDVWPRYLVPNQCDTPRCHDFTDGHGYLRLRPPESPPPTPGTPIAQWPLGWRENYLSAIQLVRCDAPLESRLLTVPEGVGDLHPPGPVVLDRATARAVIQTWVTR